MRTLKIYKRKKKNICNKYAKKNTNSRKHKCKNIKSIKKNK